MKREDYSSSTGDRGMCSVCGRGPFLLTRKGTVRHHADYRRDEYHCAGAGKPPKSDR